MKSKQKKVDQYIYHEVDDHEKIEVFLQKTAPLIGHIVHRFNTLEECLNLEICQWLNTRTDTFGLIVLHKMNYSAKVDLLKRFCIVYQRDCQITMPTAEKLISNLNEAGRLRNAVVHAEWENTDFDGYTHVNIKFNKEGFTQEYIQFTEVSLTAILNLIDETIDLFDDLDDEKQIR
jgi:hypothetical protein